MSTHDLSRTVIEGGRYFGNRDDRRASHGRARCAVRATLRAFTDDPSRFDDTPLPCLPHVPARPRDHLGAAERWLHGHVGRPWWKVEGEIRAKFDPRTIAGQHVVFDHLLPRDDPRWPISPGGPSGWRVGRRWRFFLDRHGFLRAAPAERAWNRPTEPRPETRAWLRGRRVRSTGTERYWLVPTGGARRDGMLGYRQGEALTNAEHLRFERLSAPDRIYATTRLTREAAEREEGERALTARSSSRPAPSGP